MTRFTDLVGCQHPIQLAAMSRTVTPELAAGVSNLGGLGMLAMGRPTLDAARQQVERVLAITDGPIGAGFLIPFLDRAVLEEVAARLPIIEFFWGWPDASLVQSDVLTGWQVGSADEARAAADAGCHYVVAQGVEAGGHVRSEIPLAELLPAVRAAVNVPVVAAGGIGTGADVRSALLRGADAVRIGTRFVATVESESNDRYVELLIKATAADTVLTTSFDVGWPNAPHRVLADSLLASEAADDGVIAQISMPDGSVIDVPRWSTTPPNRTTSGNIDAMALYAGTSCGAVTERSTLAGVMNELLAGTRPPEVRTQ